MFDKNSFLAGLAVGRRITAMLQNNLYDGIIETNREKNEDVQKVNVELENKSDEAEIHL